MLVVERLSATFPTRPTASWPPDYVKHFQWRQEQADRLRADKNLLDAANEYYRRYPAAFIQHWGITFDPRNVGTDQPAYLPFILFPKQREMLQFILECLRDRESGLIEKSRGMGATWLAVALSVWLWKYMIGASIGWGSRKSELVDHLGVPDSIFEKLRIFIRWLPDVFYPKGFDPEEHMPNMRILNPETGQVISGEGGDNIGRGGRNTIYFKDESAHYERPEKIEAALASNTFCQIDISSVHGIGNVFHRKRDAGVEWTPGAKLPKGRTRVFVLDWTAHPQLTQEWYDRSKQEYIDRGLKHIWAQEMDRDYASSVAGTIIPAEWIRSSVDANIKLNLPDEGGWTAALDLADEGEATNALSLRKGNVLRVLEEWAQGDTGVTTRRAINACRAKGPIELQYDCMGVGAGFKGEANRLREERLLPREIWVTPWAAGAPPLNPEGHIIPHDRQSPLNKDFYDNLKAQAWWQVRRRFEITHRAVSDEPDFTYDTDDIISIDSSLALLHKLIKELSQPTFGQSSRLKLLVDKTPSGSKSPNLADSFVMCYWPVPGRRPMMITNEIIARMSSMGRGIQPGL